MIVGDELERDRLLFLHSRQKRPRLNDRRTILRSLGQDADEPQLCDRARKHFVTRSSFPPTGKLARETRARENPARPARSHREDISREVGQNILSLLAGELRSRPTLRTGRPLTASRTMADFTGRAWRGGQDDLAHSHAGVERVAGAKSRRASIVRISYRTNAGRRRRPENVQIAIRHEWRPRASLVS